MSRVIALLSAAGLAASAMGQTAPPTLQIVVRTGTTDAVPGVTSISEPNARWRLAGTAWQAPQIDNLGNVIFLGTLENTVSVAHPIAGGTAIASATGIWYGGTWAGTNGTGSLKLIARTGYGMLPTGNALWNATTNNNNVLGNAAPTSTGPWAIAQGTSLNSTFSLTGNGNFTVNYGQSSLLPTTAQVTAGNESINGILGGKATDTSVFPNVFRATNERMVWTGQVALASNSQTVDKSLSLLAQKGDLAPNTLGSVFSSNADAFGIQFLVDSKGRTSSLQQFRNGVGDTDGTLGGSSPVPSTNNFALYFGSKASDQQMIYRIGTNNSSSWNTTSGGRTAVDYSWLPVAGSVIGNTGNVMNNGNAELVFTANMRNDAALGISDANSPLLAKRTASGTVSVVAQSGQAAPGITGAVFPANSQTIGAPFTLASGGNFNSSGQFLYGSSLANASGSTSITTANSYAVFVASISGTTQKVFRQSGDAAPIIGGDAFDPVNLRITSPSVARLNNQRQVLWTPTLVGSGVNPSIANGTVDAGTVNTSSALYLSQLDADGNTTSDSLIARRGDLVGAVYGNNPVLRWGGFFSTVLNNSGQFVFSTTFQNATGSTTGQPNVLFAWDPLTGFQKVVAVGDIIDGISVSSFSLSTQYSAEGVSAFTDNGWLTFSITGPTVGGIAQKAIIRTQIIPAPGAASMLGLAGIAALRRRRRN